MLLVMLGVGLRVWAYVGNRSFWLDEILLSRNIVALPLRSLLTEPLQLDQVAPRGFLLVEKLAVLAFGDSELVLRLFPFLCGITGLVLFRRVAERVLDGPAVPFAVGLFALGIPFIRYAAEVKQYGIDATVAVLVLLVALDLEERLASTRRLVLVGLIGAALGWISQASMLVMAGTGVALALRWLGARDRQTGRVLLISMPWWALGAVLAGAAGLRSMTPSTRDFMHGFWAQGFYPFPVRVGSGARWFMTQMASMFTDPSLLRYGLPAVFLLVGLVGFGVLWRTRRDTAVLLLASIAVALAAAVAHQYPFRGRLLCYLLPGILLTISAGVEWIRRQLSRGHGSLGWAAMLGLAVPPVIAIVTTPPPYDIEHHRDILAYLERHRQPGGVLYVFPLSRVGALFYGPRFGLAPGAWTTAVCDRDDTRAYLRDVDRFRGVRRLWVISAGAVVLRPAREAVRDYLSTIGVRRDALAFPSLMFRDSGIELYDLSDSTRLRAATAASFPVRPMPTNPPPGCRPWARPSPLDSLLLTGAH
jgi:hypothetical protein